jgi:small subunit ribosomal protein S9
MSEATNKYIEAVGRRKTSVARVRLYEAAKMSYTINDREFADYFPTAELQRVVTEPFAKVKVLSKYKITAHINGGGISSQSVAMRLGISRALLEVDKEFRGKLKKEGFLKRDPRAKERRKFGLKKARKAPQWSKR